MLQVYKIRRETNAILSKDHTLYRSLILEGAKKIPSIHGPEKILEDNCIHNGASLEGRQQSAQEILQTKIKVPIPVFPNCGIFMVPTKSLKSKDCGLFSYYQIRNFEQRDRGTFVRFYDGSGVVVNVSKSSFNMQYKKAGQLIANLHRNMIFK